MLGKKPDEYANLRFKLHAVNPHSLLQEAVAKNTYEGSLYETVLSEIYIADTWHCFEYRFRFVEGGVPYSRCY